MTTLEQSKIQIIQSNIDILKGKNKQFELSRDIVEQRMTTIQKNISIYLLQANSNVSNKENSLMKNNYVNDSFDQKLQKSQLFSQYLQAIDKNAMQNYQKIQQYINTKLESAQKSFSNLEDSLLELISQKEKIISSLSHQIASHSYSIQTLEQWTRIDQSKANHYQIIEENMKIKISALEDQWSIRFDSFTQRVKSMEIKGEIWENNKKKIHELQDSISNLEKKLDQSKRNIKVKDQQINQSFSDKSKDKNHREKQVQSSKKFNKEIQKLNEQLQQVNDTANENKSKIKKMQKRISVIEETNESSKMNMNMNMNMNMKSNFSQKHLISKKNQHRQSEGSDSYGNIQIQKQLHQNNKEKKQVQRQVSHLMQSKQAQNSSNSMKGGRLKSLLRKSKEKEQRQIPFHSNPLNSNTLSSLKKPLPPKKSLPPVKADITVQKRLNNLQQEEQEEQDQMYIDEEGFLMDQYGNYLNDQNGNIIKLTEQYLEEINAQRF